MPEELGSFEFKIDLGDAGQQLDDFGKKIDDTRKKTEDTGNASGKSFMTFKQALKDAQNEAQRLAMAVEAGDKKSAAAYKDALKKVAELKDKFGEYRQSVDTFNPDNKLQGFVSLAKGATGAIQGWTGAMSFLGKESEGSAETIKKLQGLMAFSSALNSVDDIKNSFKNLKAVAGDAATGMGGFAKALFGLEGAEAAGAAGAKLLRGALMSIGIGLLIAAVGYLIEHWDKVKESLAKVFPWINKVGDAFNQVKQVVMGVGGVIVGFISNIGSAIGALMHGNFEDAKKFASAAIDVQKNYGEAAAAEAADQAKEAQKEQDKRWIEEKERLVKVMKAKGQDTYALEREIGKKKLAAIDGNSDEEKKKRADAQNDIEVLDAEHQKKQDDKAKEARKKAQEIAKQQSADHRSLEDKLRGHHRELESIQDEALKKRAEAGMTAMQKELAENKAQAESQRKKVNEVYSDDLRALEEALKKGTIKRAEYNKKVADIERENERVLKTISEDEGANDLAIKKKNYDEVDKFLNEHNLNEVAKRKQEIIDRYKTLLEQAEGNPDRIKLLEAMKISDLNQVDDQDKLHKATVVAETQQVNTQTNNVVMDDDSIAAKREKEEALYNADKTALEAQQAEQLAMFKGTEEEKTKLKADQLKARKDLDNKYHQDQKTLNKEERQGKMDTYKAIGDAMGALGGLFKKQTVANKALNVANAVMNTGLGITQIWANKTTLPEPFGTAQKVASTVIAATSGFSAIKSILKADAGDGGGGAAPQIDTAPQINPVELSGQGGPQDVRVVNQENSVTRAYIAPRDLQDHEDEKNFLNKVSSW